MLGKQNFSLAQKAVRELGKERFLPGILIFQTKNPFGRAFQVKLAYITMKIVSLCSIASAVLACGSLCAQDGHEQPVPLVSLEPLPDVPEKPDRYFMSIAGGYAFSRDDDMPGMPGVVMDVGVCGRTWKILHEAFVSFGYYAGEDSYSFEEARDRFGVEAWYDDRFRSQVKHEVESMPLTVGYRMTAPLGNSCISLFAGARFGISFFRDEFVQPAWCSHTCKDDPWDDDDDDCYEDCDRTLAKKSSVKRLWAIDGGMKVALSNSVELALGYEYCRIGSMKPWHIIQVGVTWTF